MFPGLIKNLSYRPSFFQLAFEAQPACVSLKFLNCCFIIASCFLETLFHRNMCYLIAKLKDWANIFSTIYSALSNSFTCSRSMAVTVEVYKLKSCPVH